MNRSDIIAAMMEKYPALKSKQLDAAVKNLFNMMADHLIDGDNIEIRGFASISVKKRKACVVRNPNNGSTFLSHERPVVYFRAGKELKERVNTTDNTL